LVGNSVSVWKFIYPHFEKYLIAILMPSG